MPTDDYADFRSPEKGDNLTSVLRGLADLYVEAEAEVKRIEQELIEANNYLKTIAENLIPQATDGMEGKFNLGDGRELTIKEEIRSSIAGEKRVPAIKWLDDNEYGHIVKRELIFEFPKGEHERSKKFIELVGQLDLGPLVMKENYTVHHATLNSWVKERLKDGVELPKETFGIYHQKTAKVKDISE